MATKRTEWGLLCDRMADFELAVVPYRKWEEDAVKDGWIAEPMYEKGESMETALSLRKDGFHVQMIRRPPKDRTKGNIDGSIWGPDGLQIPWQMEYNWDNLVAATRVCGNCGAQDVPTFRYSFAGRCCKDCLPKMRAKYEKPGWCD